MSTKTKFIIKTDRFAEFIDRLDDLTKIEDTIKLKIDSENILMYAMLGGNVMLAFKNYLLKTEDFLGFTHFDQTIDVILPNAKKFVKNLNFLKESKSPTLEVSWKVSPDDEMILNARSVQITGGKLKVNWLTGEHYEMRDITKKILAQRLDLKQRRWSFNISKQDFSDIKKLSSINSERIINISVISGVVTFAEKAAWEMEVDKLEEQKTTNLMLNKKFLSSINDEGETVEFNIFDSFMLIKHAESNLMLSFEQDFSDE
jgi:hypothetical protein